MYIYIFFFSFYLFQNFYRAIMEHAHGNFTNQIFMSDGKSMHQLFQSTVFKVVKGGK